MFGYKDHHHVLPGSFLQIRGAKARAGPMGTSAFCLVMWAFEAGAPCACAETYFFCV